MRQKFYFLKVLSLLSIFCFFGGVNLWADNYTATFASGDFDAKSSAATNVTATVSDVTWTINNIVAYLNFDSTNGVQIGSSKNPNKEFTFSTDGISGTITKVTITAKTGNQGKCTMSLSVGGTQWGEQKSLTSTLTEYTFTGANAGSISFAFNASAKAMYIKSITVEYSLSDNVVIAPTFSTQSGTFTNPFTLTLSTVTDGASIYYTLDGTNPSESSTLYTEAGIAIGKANTTVKAVAVKDGTSSEIATATYTYLDPAQINTYVKVTSTDDLVAGGVYLIVSEDYSAAMGINKGNYRESATITATDGKIELNVQEIASSTTDAKVYEFVLGGATDAWTFYDKVNGGYLCSQTSTDNYLTVLSSVSDLAQATISLNSLKNATITFGGDGNRKTIKFNNNTTPNRFSCYQSSSQKVVQLYRKAGAFAITSAGYATYYTNAAFVMPQGVTGAVVKEENNHNLTLDYKYTAGTIVPAKTPLLLKGAEGTYTYTIAQTDEEADAENLLHGTVDDNGLTSVGDGGAYKYYKLANGSEGLGFYYAAADGAAFTNGESKAYLALSEASAAAGRASFSFDNMNTATGITAAAVNHSAPIVYDLNGRRIRVSNLNGLSKGLYIVNGVKTLVK